MPCDDGLCSAAEPLKLLTALHQSDCSCKLILVAAALVWRLVKQALCGT
jgi:hypothetical protein